MIKIANNLQKLYNNPTAMGVGSGLLGGGLSAGLFHFLADKEKRTLVNYLLAASAGALPAGVVGLIPSALNSNAWAKEHTGTAEGRVANEAAAQAAKAEASMGKS